MQQIILQISTMHIFTYCGMLQHYHLHVPKMHNEISNTLNEIFISHKKGVRNDHCYNYGGIHNSLHLGDYCKLGLFIYIPWWYHQMETFSAILAICAGNSPVPGEFPAQRPVTRSFDVFFDLRLNKQLSKQLWGWWFETLSHPLWRHCNGEYIILAHNPT